MKKPNVNKYYRIDPSDGQESLFDRESNLKYPYEYTYFAETYLLRFKSPITGKGCVEISTESRSTYFRLSSVAACIIRTRYGGKVRETSIAITFKRATLFLSLSFVRDILISLVARQPRSKQRNESSVVRASLLTDFKYLSNNREDRAIRRANSLGYRER